MRRLFLGTHVFWDVISGVPQPLFDPPTVEHEPVRDDGHQDEYDQGKHHGQDDRCLFRVLFWKIRSSDLKILTSTKTTAGRTHDTPASHGWPR